MPAISEKMSGAQEDEKGGRGGGGGGVSLRSTGGKSSGYRSKTPQWAGRQKSKESGAEGRRGSRLARHIQERNCWC